MKTFPMFLKMTDRRVVIIGGGEQAMQKARLVMKTEAEIVLVAPEIEADLQALVTAGRVYHRTGGTDDLFENTALVFIGTGCKGTDAAWHARAKAAGALVNVVDYPNLCDAITPSIVDRDPVVVAIGTEGTAPVLGRRIKTRIEQMLHPRIGAYAALAGRMRATVARHIESHMRRDFWRWVFNGTPWRTFSSGLESEAERQIQDRVASGHLTQQGRISVILGAEDSGMIPLAAVERLQEADMIYVDDGVPDAVLELARRDAERVRIGGIPFASQNLNAAANVVYLTPAFQPIIASPDSRTVIEHIRCATQTSLGHVLDAAQAKQPALSVLSH
ncbi:MAG: NAD(P)-dependent oxidoreductase [Pseudomonadota bacterium]